MKSYLKIHFFVAALLIFTTPFVQAQNSGSGNSKTVLFEIGDQQVTKNEFTYIYEKNNSNDPNLYSKESLQDYLDLYINFKLKVKAAKEAGLDTTQEFKKEFRKYRNQLAEPYLGNDSLMDHLIKEAYQRKQQQIKARHISIKIPKGASPEDTASAFETLKKIKQEFNDGKDFDQLAKEYSNQVTTGNLGYFSVFKQPYPIENAAYNTAVGEVAGPVRTNYGYHLIKIIDKRPYKGKIKVRHIMIKPEGNKSDSASWEKAKAEADSVYRSLQSGVPFEKMVTMHSDDQRSKQRGGMMPAFNRLNPYFPQNFKNKAFSLEENGEMTKPFKTRYGYHILQRVELQKPDSLSKIKPQLKEKIKKGSRYELVKTSVIKRIKKESGFKEFDKGLTSVKEQLDSTFFTGKWEIKAEEKLKTPLFKIGDSEVSALEFAKYLETHQNKRGKSQDIEHALRAKYEDFKRSRILDHERKRLDEKYPEFKNLVKEYKEGILLFEIMDQKVWSKAISDTAGLKAFYENHKKDYSSPPRKIAHLIECPNKKVQKSIFKDLKGNDKENIQQYLNSEFPGKTISYKLDTFENTNNPVVSKTKDKEGSYRVKHNGNFYIVKVESFKPAGVKPLNTIRGKVVADYQKHLEDKWLKQLKAKYPVKVNEEVLESMVKE